MYCMKCGKEIPSKQAFCDDCLEVMARFPVKPETHVLLPNRETSTASKKSPVRKNILSTEERLVQTKKVIQWLSIALAATFFALVLSVSLLIETMAPETQSGAIGQNYSTTDAQRGID